LLTTDCRLSPYLRKMDKRLFLLDAFALIFRAYYALLRNPRLTTKGKNTNTQFGFTNTLVELINNRNPTHMAVCFDTQAPTERHTDFAEYKANRQEAPEDILAAIPDIKKIVRGFNIPIMELDGFEADDVIGTLSKQAALAGYEVYMVTPDKDYGQLVDDKIKIYKTAYQGGDVEIMGPKEVCEKWNIQNVDQVIDMLGMMGDAVDNIPGIPGVGQKTAAKLLAEYGTLENVLANADSLKGAMGEKVRKGKDAAIMSKKLATIITTVPVQFHEEDFRLKEWNKQALKEVFAELEFKTLGKRVLGEDFNAFAGPTEGVQAALFEEKEVVTAETPVETDLFGNVIQKKPQAKATEATQSAEGTVAERNIHNTPHEYKVVQTDTEIEGLIRELNQHEEISFDTETTGIDANDVELVGMSFSTTPGTGYYIPCPADQAATQKIVDKFKPLFADNSKTWIGQNIKYDMLVFKWYGVEITGKLFDTML